MSIATELSRIQSDRNTIRAKLVELGMATSVDKLDALASAIEGIVNRGAVSVEILEGTTYTIPAGYHNGSGVVRAMTDTEGEAEKYKTQAKTTTPTKKQQSVTPDTGYYALSSVTVGAIPDAYQDVSSVTAAAGDVLTGKIFVASDGTVVTGTMVNNGAVSKTLDGTTITYTIPKGYHNGSGTVKIVLETKTVTPTKRAQDITPTTGKVLSKVTVAAIPDKYVDTSDANAVAANILAGKTAYVGGAKVTGTMPNNGDKFATLDASTEVFFIPEGYHSGAGAVQINKRDKTVTPTKERQIVTPDDGTVLIEVTVDPIPAAYQDVTGVTAAAADVLTGKKIVAADGSVVNGSMANNGSTGGSIDGLTTTSVTIPAGYTTGGTVSLTSDIEDSLASI